MARKENSAGAIIFYRKNKEVYFLLLEYPTYWGFVRGKIEKDENITQTIIREAKEEANIDKLNFIKGFEEIQNWYTTVNKETIKRNAIFYLAEISEEHAKHVKISKEHKAFEFLTINQALDKMRIENEKIMLKKSYEFIKK